jgi:cell division protein FtsX
MDNEITNTLSQEPKSGGTGAIIGAIIIIILLVAGGWYFIGNRIEKIESQKNSSTEVTIDLSTGTSTEIEDIEADLKNLDLKVLN